MNPRSELSVILEHLVLSLFKEVGIKGLIESLTFPSLLVFVTSLTRIFENVASAITLMDRLAIALPTFLRTSSLLVSVANLVKVLLVSLEKTAAPAAETAM